MEREPIFGGYEKDPIMPEIKTDRVFEKNVEKKDKNKKSRDWREVRESRDRRENREYAEERAEPKAKKAGEGVLGLANKEGGDDKVRSGEQESSSIGAEILGTVVLDRPPAAEAGASSAALEESDAIPHAVEEASVSEAPHEVPLASTGNPTSMFERTIDSKSGDAEDDVVVAEVVEETDADNESEAAEIVRDVVDAEIVASDPTEKEPAPAASLPATTASQAPFIHARPRMAAGGGSGGSGGASGGGSGSGHGGGSGGSGGSGAAPSGAPFAGGPSHGGGAPNFNTTGHFNTIPIPVPVEKDPFAYQRGKRRGLAQGLLAGGVGGWLLGRRGGKKKLAAAERQHAAKTAEQNKRIKQLEYEKDKPTTVEPEKVEAAIPLQAEAPRPAMERILSSNGVAVERPTRAAAAEVTSMGAPHETRVDPVVATHEKAAEVRIEQLPEQASGVEADSKVREDAFEKLDQPQDQGGLNGGGAAVVGDAVSHESRHTSGKPTIGPAQSHDPLARSVLSARKQAQIAAQQAARRAQLEAAGLVAVALAVVIYIVIKLVT